VKRRTFNYAKGNSDKFWSVWVEPTGPTGYRLFAHWGRNGTDGQRKSWFFATRAEATREALRKIAGKLKKGYLEDTPREATVVGSIAQTRWRKDKSALAGPPSRKPKPKPKPTLPSGFISPRRVLRVTKEDL